MSIRIYSTLARKKIEFEPIDPGRVSIYVCGPTVYDSCHIGHARSVVVFDVIARYFRSRGFDVKYIRNFTDVDDKIISRANQLGMKTSELAEKYIDEFHEDMDALYVERPTREPRATDHINDIIDLISQLIEKNAAYEIDGDVFFRVTAFDSYGKLSGRKLEDMEAGSRVDVDKRKESPFDFALWKSEKPGEPSWESPWGKGRPGWHIECSAMSTKLLDKTFDIHGGGKDLIFPHHENEIAQSEAAFGNSFARYWIHNGFVNINHEKMSKSLGNFTIIKDVLKTYHPEVVRIFLLSHHYRSPIDFNDKSMDDAGTALDKLYTLKNRVEDSGLNQSSSDNVEQGDFYKKFIKAMDDDFNTALGIGVLFEAVRNLNRILDTKKPLELQLTVFHFSQIMKMAGILGILNDDAESYFSKKRKIAIKTCDLDKDKIQELVNERESARKDREWKKADEIRDRLKAMNVILEDSQGGTVWKISES